MKDQKWKKMTLLDGTELEDKFKNGNLLFIFLNIIVMVKKVASYFYL